MRELTPRPRGRTAPSATTKQSERMAVMAAPVSDDTRREPCMRWGALSVNLNVASGLL